MDFRIDKPDQGPSGITRLKATITDSAGNRLSKGLGSTKGDTSRITSEPVKVSNLLVASNAKSFLEIAASAANAIVTLREEQLGWAEKAEATADSEKQAEYQTEISTLQSEIERVARDAVYNGQSVLSGGGFNLDESDDSSHGAIVSANAEFLSASQSISLASQTGATAAVATLEDVVLSARQTRNNLEQALGKAETVLEDSIAEANITRLEKDGLSKIKQAEDLANKVSNDIKSKYKPEDTNQAVLNTLDPERVSLLLSD